MMPISLQILFSLFIYGVNAEILNRAIKPIRIVKSTMEFYRSRSVVLLFDENLNNSGFVFLTIQKQLSFKDFYFSSLTTPSGFRKSLQNTRSGTRETVVVLNASTNVIPLLEKAFYETDMTSRKWLLTTETLSPQNFHNVTIPLPSELIVARRKPGSETYDLEEIYDIRPKLKTTKPLGPWLEGEELNMESDLFKRRRNLEGVAIRVLSYETDICKTQSFFVGLGLIVSCTLQKVWEEHSIMLNATTEILTTSNLTSNSIETTEAELTFRSAPLNAFQLDTRSFLWPVFKGKIVLVTRQLEQRVKWQTYIFPFSQEMWLVILLWMLLCDFTLAFVEFVIRRKETNNSFTGSWREFLFSTAFTYCNQGVLVPSTLFTTRIVFLMMLIVPAVLFPGYSAVLTSFLTVQQHKKPFQSLEELSRTDEYKLAWRRTFPLSHLFNLKNMDPLNQALLHNNVLPQDKLPETDFEGLKKMCKEKFSYLTVKDTILAVKPKCSFYTLRQQFRLIFSSIELKKGSWYKFLMDRCERKLEFTGVLGRLKGHSVLHLVRYNENFIIRSTKVDPIKMENIVLPFAMLLLGVVTSIFLLLLEVAWFKLNSTERSP